MFSEIINRFKSVYRILLSSYSNSKILYFQQSLEGLKEIAQASVVDCYEDEDNTKKIEITEGMNGQKNMVVTPKVNFTVCIYILIQPALKIFSVALAMLFVMLNVYVIVS